MYLYNRMPMPRKIDWDSQIGRRLRLRDLHVFHAVAQNRSMAKAAVQLGVSQPAISEVIADLEHALGVRLLDRFPQGVEPTMYIEFLFDDQLVIAVGAKSKWAARRRKIDLAELIDEPWIMQAPHSWNYRILSEACGARGLAMPRASLVTLSMSVITHFLAGGRFITSMPRSVAHFKSLKILPLDLPSRPWPVNVVTLRNRTLSPVVDRFIESARDFTRPMREQRLPPKR